MPIKQNKSMANIIDTIKNDFLILDGAMGTQIQKANLQFKHSPEELNLTAPDAITNIHRSYVAVGADYVCTNTFQANGYKLTKGLDLFEVISAAIKNARASGAKFVALDVGPTGKLIEPMGEMKYEEAYEIFKEVVMCGEKAGADLISFETFTSLAEIRIALLAAKENTNLPVFCTMSYDGMRSLSGAAVGNQMLTLGVLGADAVGFNCSVGPDEMLPLVEEAVRWTNLPIIAKPNAGLPNGKTYSAVEFAASMGKLIDAGASIVGGCCGTNPDYIRELKSVVSGKKFRARQAVLPPAVCNENTIVRLDEGVKAVGERINPTGKKLFKEALIGGTYVGYAKREATSQKDAGARLLDVNCGLPEVDESVVLPELVKAVQGELPLVIDSSDSVALERALRIYAGVAVINSVNGDEESMNKVLPLVKKYGAYVVALCLDSTGIKNDADERIAIAEKIIERGEGEFGISRDRFIVDTLTLSIATGKSNAKDCLLALRKISERGIKTALGISNISFGLPNRGLINATFLAMAAAEGLTLAIVNPLVKEIGDALSGAELLLSGDVSGFISASEGKETSGVSVPTGKEISLKEAVIKGLKAEAATATRTLLKSVSSSEVIDCHLVPALDEVGKGYESGKLFLPELIASADAAKEAFAEIKASLGRSEGAKKGKIILATVKGDIHDIGKNIVKALLENYGFEVIDLGKDVPKEDVVKAALTGGVKLVGLSALMTTTARAMADTIVALRESGYSGKVMVGGAVITAEYAQKIGADYYAKDATASANIAREVYR